MRAIMTFLGVVVVIAIFAMILKSPEAKENFQKEHRKSLIVVLIPMIAFIAIVAYLLSHVGL